MHKLIATIATSAAIGAGALGIATLNPAGAGTDPSPSVDQPAGEQGVHPRAHVLQDALDQLVSDGTLSQPQADAVTAKVKELAGDSLRDGIKHRVVRGSIKIAADTIGVEPKALVDEIRAGKTVAEVAEAHDVEPQAVIDALVDAGNARIDQAVANGRLSDEKGTELKASLPERAATFVNETPHAG